MSSACGVGEVLGCSVYIDGINVGTAFDSLGTAFNSVGPINHPVDLCAQLVTIDDDPEAVLTEQCD